MTSLIISILLKRELSFGTSLFIINCFCHYSDNTMNLIDYFSSTRVDFWQNTSIEKYETNFSDFVVVFYIITTITTAITTMGL